MKLPIGRLDRRITLQTLVQGQGSVYGGNAYDIQSIEEVGRRERLNIFAALAE